MGVSFSALYSHIYRRHPNSGNIEKRKRQEQIVAMDEGDGALSDQQSSTLALPDCEDRGEDFPGIIKKKIVRFLILCLHNFYCRRISG